MAQYKDDGFELVNDDHTDDPTYDSHRKHSYGSYDNDDRYARDDRYDRDDDQKYSSRRNSGYDDDEDDPPPRQRSPKGSIDRSKSRRFCGESGKTHSSHRLCRRLFQHHWIRYL